MIRRGMRPTNNATQFGSRSLRREAALSPPSAEDELHDRVFTRAPSAPHGLPAYALRPALHDLHAACHRTLVGYGAASGPGPWEDLPEDSSTEGQAGPHLQKGTGSGDGYRRGVETGHPRVPTPVPVPEMELHNGQEVLEESANDR
ncbi:unnamed protein product [Larinioides sclopetarius]|uniref:Uncharacterized protein n=1 Tax=Larinioides sclopetarius TaxID=280406 RepID=A0AAV2BR63_9ARAC